MENMKNDSCPSQLAPHATAASPEKRLQDESLQLSDPPSLPPASPEKRLKNNSSDLTTFPSPAFFEERLHNDHVQPPDPSSPMENMKNDSCPSQLAPHATAASPGKRLHEESLQLSDLLSLPPASLEKRLENSSDPTTFSSPTFFEERLHDIQSPDSSSPMEKHL